jgi:preprotein translocase subunit YajC
MVFLQAQGGNPMFSMLLMVGMIAVMYFFMIRPQAKRAKEQKKFGESITSGEQIVTTAGIHGRISQVNEDGTLKLEIARGVFITIERSAVSMEMTSAARKKNSTSDVATA